MLDEPVPLVVVFDAIPSDVVRDTHVVAPCLFPETQGGFLNTEDDMRLRIEEIMDRHPRCPVKVGVSNNAMKRMTHTSYRSWAGLCYVVATGLEDNAHASKLESRGIVTVMEHAGTACINRNSVADDGRSGIGFDYSSTFTAQIYVAVDIRPCS